MLDNTTCIDFAYSCRCPISGNVAGLTSHSSPGSNTHRFSYRVFTMTGYENSIQYFHCTALVCSATDPTAFCNKGCDDARRRRRAVKIIDVPDRNSNFTFTTPGFFVNPSSESSGEQHNPKHCVNLICDSKKPDDQLHYLCGLGGLDLLCG